jgi:hypothetical protein
MLYFEKKFQVTHINCSCLQATCDRENAIREIDFIYRGATFLLAAGGDVCLHAGGATLHHRTNIETCLVISDINNGSFFFNQKEYIRLLQVDFFTLSPVTYRVRGEKASCPAISP